MFSTHNVHGVILSIRFVICSQYQSKYFSKQNVSNIIMTVDGTVLSSRFMWGWHITTDRVLFPVYRYSINCIPRPGVLDYFRNGLRIEIFLVPKIGVWTIPPLVPVFFGYLHFIVTCICSSLTSTSINKGRFKYS